MFCGKVDLDELHSANWVGSSMRHDELLLSVIVYGLPGCVLLSGLPVWNKDRTCQSSPEMFGLNSGSGVHPRSMIECLLVRDKSCVSCCARIDALYISSTVGYVR